MVAVYMVVGIFTTVALLLYFAEWTVHLDMVKDDCLEYYRGSYEDFLSEFDQIKWDRSPHYPTAFFGIGDEYWKHKIHANIIKFNGRGMTIGFLSYWRVLLFLRKHKETKQRFHGKWKSTIRLVK